MKAYAVFIFFISAFDRGVWVVSPISLPCSRTHIKTWSTHGSLCLLGISFLYIINQNTDGCLLKGCELSAQFCLTTEAYWPSGLCLAKDWSSVPSSTCWPGIGSGWTAWKAAMLATKTGPKEAGSQSPHGSKFMNNMWMIQNTLFCIIWSFVEK